jgi:hypothetical protein
MINSLRDDSDAGESLSLQTVSGMACDKLPCCKEACTAQPAKESSRMCAGICAFRIDRSAFSEMTARTVDAQGPASSADR